MREDALSNKNLYSIWVLVCCAGVYMGFSFEVL